MKGDFGKNLAKALAKMEKGVKKGFKIGVLKIETEAVKRAPKDVGNLKGSHYHNFSDSSDSVAAEIGFTALYATAVHENVGQVLKGLERRSGSKKGTYWETGEPKFLENAIAEKKSEVLKSIKKYTEV